MTWTPPSDDPRFITKGNYFAALEPLIKGLWINTFKLDRVYAYQALPMFVAAWKATGQHSYLDLAWQATQVYCQGLDADTQKVVSTGTSPSLGSYWLNECSFFTVTLRELANTNQHDQMAALLGSTLGNRADHFPVYPERGEAGANSRTIAAAHWYELALQLKPDLQHSAELRTFIEEIWNDWWPLRDVYGDDSHYITEMDLLLLDSWCRLRGVNWWADPAGGSNLWRHYCESVTNDGTLPAYGDGGFHGGYFHALRFGELAASLTREGRYKWLAHRAFWNGRDRVTALGPATAHITPAVELALAYLFADDTVLEVPPHDALTITSRRFRERVADTSFLILHDQWSPSKVIFRSGPSEKDHFMMVQAASFGGHGHPDSGNILHYSGDWSYFLCHGASRLDYYMEHHNVVVLRNPSIPPTPEKDGYGLPVVSEGTSVPVSGSAPDASYARIRIEEYPGVTPTVDAWQKIQALRNGFAPPRAIGYKNWPVRVDRSVLFANNNFTLVRDLVNFTLPTTAQLGQNWITGQCYEPGPNWVNTRIPRVFAQYEPNFTGPLELGDSELLIWMVPDGMSNLEVVNGPGYSWYGNYGITLPNRVWAPRSGNWPQGQQLAFATVLFPHSPSVRPVDLASKIKALRHDDGATVVNIESTASYVLAVNNSLSNINVGPFVLDAEAALLTSVAGRPKRLSAWQVGHITFEGRRIIDNPERIDVSLEGSSLMGP